MYSPSVCNCRPSKSLYRSRSRPFHMQIYVYLASYWWSLDKGVLMQMSFAIDWQVTRSFILHSFTPKSNVENVPHRPTCKHNPNCDNVGMTLGLLHNLGDGCRGQNRGRDGRGTAIACIAQLGSATAVAGRRQLSRNGDSRRGTATAVAERRQPSPRRQLSRKGYEDHQSATWLSPPEWCAAAKIAYR